MNDNADFYFKLMITGIPGSGKTSIIYQFVHKKYIYLDQSNMIVENNYRKEINHNEKKVKLHLWDTMTHERYRPLNRNYFKHFNGFMILYDVTKKDSFLAVRGFVREIEENTHSNVCMILIGNKCNSENRSVSFEEGLELARELNIQFIEVSVENNYNIDEAFTLLIDEMIGKLRGRNSIIIHNIKSKKKKCCI